MDKETSLIRRTKFSHTVYKRVGSHGLHVAPLSRELEEKLQRFVSMKKSMSMPVDRDNEETVSTLKHVASLPSLGSSLQSITEKANKKNVSLKIPSSPPAKSEKSKAPGARSLVKSPSSLMLLSYLNNQGSSLQKEKANKNVSLEIHSSPPADSKKSKTPGARSLVKSPSSMMLLSYLNNQGSSLQKANGSQHKPRSKSPLPSLAPSDVFREARAGSKRFTSPPPKRMGSEKSVYGKSLGREFSDTDPSADWCSTSVVSHKHKSQTRSGGKRRVSAVDSMRGRQVSMAQMVQTTADWTLNPSKLLVGHPFASGAYSRLYRGVYDDKPVAIKFVRQSDNDENGKIATMLEKQYNTEINALSHLYHKNVIKLVAAYKCKPVFYILTELLSGGSLRSYLHSTEHHPISLEKTISIALDVARGLEYIHSQGIVHRDIKPDNILFDENFVVKIADFGIACEETLCDLLVEDQGTYRWMAPEMMKRKPYNRKVDVYSFGLLLWEMVTGRIPYENLTPIQVAYAVVNNKTKPTMPADCPMAALGPLIEECCAYKPDKRPDFWQIVKILEKFQSVVSQGGCLDALKCSTFPDQKKSLRHWIEKLKPSHSTRAEL